MTQANPLYVNTKVNADTISWTPIVSPIRCDKLVIECDAPFKTRTDPADPDTERFWVGPFVLGGADSRRMERTFRFLPATEVGEEAAVWVQTTIGVGPLLVSWVM